MIVARIPTRSLTRWLFVTVAALSLAGAVARLHGRDFSADLVLSRVVRFFDLDGEGNVPAWFSASLLLACSALLAAIAAGRKAEGDRLASRWWLLSLVFVALSLDEVASFHEWVGLALERWVPELAAPYRAWAGAGAAFVLVVAASVAPLLRTLPTPIRRRFVVAGCVYVGGALGMEMLSGWYDHLYGIRPRMSRILAMGEEVLEMTGLVLFFSSLLAHLERLGYQAAAGRPQPRAPAFSAGVATGSNTTVEPARERSSARRKMS